MTVQKKIDDSVKAENKVHISTIENALNKEHKIEDKIRLLKAAGDAYFNGVLGAQQDYEKAYKYYKEAADLGDIECLHNAGAAQTILYLGKDEILFSFGLMQVIESYKKGYDPARNTLQFVLDTGIFPNFKSVEELIRFNENNR